jgi:FMN phosphatase YigB (HAD superfamily)
VRQVDLSGVVWVTFEVIGPLVRREPDEMASFKIRCARAGMVLTPEEARRAWARAQEWSLDQEVREWEGVAALEERVFRLARDGAALREVAPAEGFDAAALALAKAPAPNSSWRADPEARGALEELRAAGLQLGAVSHLAPDIGELLASEGLEDLVQSLASVNDVRADGLTAAVMRLALRRAQCSGAEALYVGEHPIAARCAQAAGALTAWLRREGCPPWPDRLPEPDATVERLAGISSLLGA